MTESPRRFGDLLVELGFVTNVQVQEALALQPLTGHRVGEALLSLGYLTRAQLQRALAQAINRGDPVVLDRPPLGEILIGLKYVTAPQVAVALEQQRSDGKRLGEIVVELGFCSHAQVYEGLGLQRRMARPQDVASVKPADPGVSAAPARRVVVVDDSELSCSVVQAALGAAGFDAVTFTDPFLALEQLDLLKPDLLLTDLDMPGMSGADLCRRVKESPRGHQLPVVILTANDADRERVSGLRAGADDYVSKSASMEELAARIDGILRRTSETERVRRLFARYTSDAVVEQILQSGEVVLTGERRDVTVLFADIRNFTSLAETLSPEDVMRSLNEVLGALADIVLEWGGTLDKFLGDGLMAVWGAPVRRDDDTESAMAAALQMMRAVARRNGALDGGPPLELGVGVNTGPVVAGSLGSARRTEYTCIGDAVNVASRLCALAAPGDILMGQGTAEKLSYLRAVEALPPVRLKGKAHPVPLFRATPQLEAALGRRYRF